MRLDLDANDSPPIYTLQDTGKMKCVSGSIGIRDADRFCYMGLEFLLGLYQSKEKYKKFKDKLTYARNSIYRKLICFKARGQLNYCIEFGTFNRIWSWKMACSI